MSTEILHTDAFLLESLLHNDQQAFEAIYFKYWQPLLNTVHKRLKDKQHAEDLVQNIFLALWNKRAYLQVLNLSAYLHTAAHYEVLKFVTRNKAALYFHNPLQYVMMEPGSADSKMMNAEILALVYAYAQTLPEKKRHIFMLHIQDSLNTKQIAATLNITQKTVQNQLRTALNGLHARIIPAILLMLYCLLNQ